MGETHLGHRGLMSGPPEIAKTLGSLGCLMLLIPVVLVLAGLFVAVAIAGGVTGVVVAVGLVGIVAVVVARARQPRPWRCPRCGGVFVAGSSRCPHCGVPVWPPVR